MMHLKNSPYLVYADDQGNVFEDTSLYAVGRSGWEAVPIPVDQWIALPDGGSLYQLPGRRAIGIDVRTGKMRLCLKGWAVAAFLPPAHTGFYLAAYETLPEAPLLPLFCYTATGWWKGKFYVPAVRIEQDIRQECKGFDHQQVKAGVRTMLKRYPHNRLVKHLAENCALTYFCPAARNYFLGRWECPIPVSPACNANCIGCISFQPEEVAIPSTQDRLTFKPTPEEIAEFAIPHLQQAPYPIVSFGQGCEGEPLLMWRTIRDAISLIRSQTHRGCINLNTNGSKPEAVKALCQAGLNSIRVSMNSARKDIYHAYYRPRHYQFEDLIKSLIAVKEAGGWTSINYFVFPGMTDQPAEFEALCALIETTGLDMIQWRNFNIDPDWYLKEIGVTDTASAMGIQKLMQEVHKQFPHVKFGYYNPPMERIKGNFETDFAHA